MLSLHISGGKGLHLHGHQVVKVQFFRPKVYGFPLSCNPHLSVFNSVLGLTNRTLLETIALLSLRLSGRKR